VQLIMQQLRHQSSQRSLAEHSFNGFPGCAVLRLIHPSSDGCMTHSGRSASASPQSLLLDRYLVDIEIRQARIVIEADGAQHKLRDRQHADAERDAALKAVGCRVYRFTGSEINADSAKCIQYVIDMCGLAADEEPIFDIRTTFAGPGHPRWKGGLSEFTCNQCGTSFKKARKHRTGDNTFCSQQCYGAWLHEHPEASKRRLERDWSELAQLYAAGMSTKQLAKRYACSQRAILTAMRHLGIQVRPQGGYRLPGGFYKNS